MQLERRIWYPGVDHPVIQRTTDRGPYTLWPAPTPGWDTIEVVRRKTYVPWLLIVIGAWVVIDSFMVALGIFHYPVWVQAVNGFCVGAWCLATGADKLSNRSPKKRLFGRRRNEERDNPAS